MPFILRLSIILFLSFTISDAVTLSNKDWVNKKNLLKPIMLTINGEKLNLDKDISKVVEYYRNKPFDFYFLPKNKKVSKNTIKCAKNLKKNIYLLRPKKDKPIVLPHDLTWSENPFSDRNWEWSFHSLSFIDCLFSGFISSNDPWYLIRLKWIVQDWWKDNFKADFPSKEFSWNDHTIPNRLHQFLRIFEFVRRNNALDNDFTKAVLRAIYWHTRILTEEKPLYLKNHNHGLVQSDVIFQVSQIFPEFTLSEEWKNIAKKRLNNEITFALTSEGVHKENSPGYHAWVSAYCTRINNFSEHYTGHSITKNNDKLQEEGLRFLTTITKPDGRLPLLGDTSSNKKTRAQYPNLKNLIWYPYYQYVTSNGKQGAKPKETVSIFPESGYYIYRDKWDETGENSATQLILKCGYLAFGHRHNDDGNILLYGLGEDWLIDAGMYGYKYDHNRDYITSPSAHNISFPYQTKISPPSDKKKINSLKTRLIKYKNNWGIIEADNTHVICESHMFKGYTYKRTLEIIGKRSFNLSDSITPEKRKQNKKNKFVTVFRVPDNKSIYINSKKKIIMAVNESENTALEIHYKKTFQDIKLFRGEVGDIISLETSGWLNLRPVKTIAFVDQDKSYSANFKLHLIVLPSLEGFSKMDINHTPIETKWDMVTSFFTN